MKVGLLGVVLMIAACDSPRSPAIDAPVADTVPDVDAQIDDAPIDAADAAIDAPVSTSPRCTTTPTIFWDVSPKVLGNIAHAGNLLYVSAYTSSAAGPSDAVIITLDLTTGLQVGADQPTARPVALWESASAVYGADAADDGTVWKLEPGQAPVAFLEHVPTPGPALEDGAYLYFTDHAWNLPNGMVRRRLISGGPVEDVIPCNDARDLMIDGASIYCVGWQSVLRGLKAGGGLPESVSVPDSYPFVSATIAGDAIYYVRLFNRLYRQPLFGSSATSVHETTMIGSRYVGLTATSDVVYVVDQNWGIWRIDRTTYAAQHIVHAPSIAGDPVVWNDQLFYQAPNPQLPFTSYVMRCVD